MYVQSLKYVNVTDRLYSWGYKYESASLFIKQWCGSPKFWYGSGSADLYGTHWLMDPDPATFVSDLQDVNKNLVFFLIFLLLTFWRYITSFFKVENREVTNSRNQCFFYYFCLMIEGSGSGRLNIWILRIRIRNTGIKGARSKKRRAIMWCFSDWAQLFV